MSRHITCPGKLNTLQTSLPTNTSLTPSHWPMPSPPTSPTSILAGSTIRNKSSPGTAIVYFCVVVRRAGNHHTARTHCFLRTTGQLGNPNSSSMFPPDVQTHILEMAGNLPIDWTLPTPSSSRASTSTKPLQQGMSAASSQCSHQTRRQRRQRCRPRCRDALRHRRFAL